MTEQRLFIRQQSAAEYVQRFPERLNAHDLEVGAHVNLMLRCDDEGIGPEAFQGPILIEKIEQRMGYACLTTWFLNDDMMPTGYRVFSQVKNDIWFPIIPYPLISPNGKLDTESRQGYFLPYKHQAFPETIGEIDQSFEDALTKKRQEPVPINRLIDGQ